MSQPTITKMEPITKVPTKTAKLSGVKGMNDLLPPDSALWEKLEKSLVSLARSYGYQNIRTPILENTGVFLAWYWRGNGYR
jgi:histidyl-tRNA synthetase